MNSKPVIISIISIASILLLAVVFLGLENDKLKKHISYLGEQKEMQSETIDSLRGEKQVLMDDQNKMKSDFESEIMSLECNNTIHFQDTVYIEDVHDFALATFGLERMKGIECAQPYLAARPKDTSDWWYAIGEDGPGGSINLVGYVIIRSGEVVLPEVSPKHIVTIADDRLVDTHPEGERLPVLNASNTAAAFIEGNKAVVFDFLKQEYTDIYELEDGFTFESGFQGPHKLFWSDEYTVSIDLYGIDAQIAEGENQKPIAKTIEVEYAK